MLRHYAEYHEERLQKAYIQYNAFIKQGYPNYAEQVLITNILPDVHSLRYAVWHKHFSTPGRIQFVQNQLCTHSIYLPLALEIKYPIKIK
jgi:hypothetical protein